jgi:hypothetical protein
VTKISRTLANIGFLLALIGSIILILLGIGAILGIFFLIFFPLYALGAFFWGIAILIIGLLASASSRFVNHVVPAIWLIILAIVASLFGAGFIAWLIAIGGIIGLISRL